MRLSDGNQLSVNEVHLFGSMAEGIEMVTHLITIYALFESVYLSSPRESCTRDIIKPALVRLYAAILRYLSKAKQYYDRSTSGIVNMFLYLDKTTLIQTS